MELVSVVIPTYNRANLLARCIQSVLDQQYEHLHIIIIDDGSTDNTSDIIRAIDCPHIEYVRFTKNYGIGTARHEGIKRTQGELIAFIDADDIWLPGKLHHQVQLFQTYAHIDLIFGNYINVNQTAHTQEEGFKQNAHGLEILATKSLESEVKEIVSGFPEALLKQNFISPPTVMFRRRLLDQVGNFERSLSGPEDLEFWWRAALLGAKFAYTDRPLSVRYKDKNSITSQAFQFIPQLLRALDICEASALAFNREELLPSIKYARHIGWRTLLRAYTEQGKRRQAFACFLKSLRFGMSRKAFVYLLVAMGGKTIVGRGRLVKEKLNMVGKKT